MTFKAEFLIPHRETKRAGFAGSGGMQRELGPELMFLVTTQ